MRFRLLISSLVIESHLPGEKERERDLDTRYEVGTIGLSRTSWNAR